ncbi:acetamidase/formamidase [Paenibacillus eucommiae]|uniref:Acetamidase/formamidase n=2 Tax=Paenibacillus eucommiae TaxID=1355755 RepID=A0ABS4IQ04_9BACL|nr:acetamidase/formamidase [Paenibacillus eucommiae]
MSRFDAEWNWRNGYISCIIRLNKQGRGVCKMNKELQPIRYYGTIGWHEPQAVVKSGETITVHTVDADGWDRFGERVDSSGNPMSGPLYVEGAEPGDMLEVCWESIVPSRDWGWSVNMCARHGR